MTNEQIEQVLMQLPSGDRARLAERLIASLDADAEVEAAWIAEARRRDEEMRSGAVEGISLKDARDSVRSRFGW